MSAATLAAVRERPILFSGAMVRALLARTKTQTRRVVKVPRWFVPPADESMVAAAMRHELPLAYGAPGDRLWVREGIRLFDWMDGGETSVEYLADRELHPDAEWVWKPAQLPSMLMPRGLSRITLELTDVRVERLQAISEDDARAEGVGRESWPEDCTNEDDALNVECGYFPPRSHVAAYARLWDSLNAKRGAGWDVNPWVWVLTFRRLGAP